MPPGLASEPARCTSYQGEVESRRAGSPLHCATSAIPRGAKPHPHGPGMHMAGRVGGGKISHQERRNHDAPKPSWVGRSQPKLGCAAGAATGGSHGCVAVSHDDLKAVVHGNVVATKAEM